MSAGFVETGGGGSAGLAVAAPVVDAVPLVAVAGFAPWGGWPTTNSLSEVLSARDHASGDVRHTVFGLQPGSLTNEIFTSFETKPSSRIFAFATSTSLPAKSGIKNHERPARYSPRHGFSFCTRSFTGIAVEAGLPGAGIW